MSSIYDDELITPPPRRRGRLGLVLAVALIAFLCGLAAMGWVLKNWPRARAEFIGAETVPTPARPSIAPAIVRAPAASVPLVAPIAEPSPAQATAQVAGDLDVVSERLSALDQRVARLDDRASAAIGNAGRAEGMLLAVASRRALDRGVALGFLEGRLRERFGATQPQAVAVLLAASRQPVTVDSLRSGLDDLAPRLVSDPQTESWWQSFRREIGGLVVVRRSDVPSTEPADRLARATALVDEGHVDRALAEVNRLPGRAQAAAWMAAARRYIAAHDALDALETAALLDPGTSPAPAPAAPTSAPAAAGEAD